VVKIKRTNSKSRTIYVKNKHIYLIERSLIYCKENNITFTDLVMEALIEYLTPKVGSIKIMYTKKNFKE